MPSSLVTIRYGEPAAEGELRPSILRLQYPTWTLAAEPRVRMPYRMQVTQAVVGSHIAPLTRDPVVIDMDLALRQRRGATRLHVGNPVVALVPLRAVQGQPLVLQWGGEIDWGDNWYLTGIDLGFQLPAQYPPDIGGSSPKDGGMVFDTIGVRLSFTTDDLELTAPVLDVDVRTLDTVGLLDT